MAKNNIKKIVDNSVDNVETSTESMKRGIGDTKETSFDFLSTDKYVLCWSTDYHWKNTFRSWYEEAPDECGRFIDEGPNPDDAVTLEIPKAWMKYIRPARKKTLSDEQRKALGERLKKNKSKGK